MMVMTAEAEEVPKTAERTPLISNDHCESSRIHLSFSPVQKNLVRPRFAAAF